MHTKLGFFIDSLGPSQMAFQMIHNTNLLLQKRGDTDIIAFFENPQKACYIPNFAAMNVNQAWYYDGVMVATSLSTLEKTLKYPRLRERYFYSYDLEWTRFNPKQFEQLMNLYCNKNIRIFARCDDHAQAIQSVWNTPIRATIPDFDVEKILEVVQEDASRKK